MYPINSTSLVMLVLRLLASAQDPVVCRDAHTVLQAARDITFRWLYELLAKLEAAEVNPQIMDYQERVCEVAAICRFTYDADPAELDLLLSRSDEFSTFIICAVHLHNNRPFNIGESSHNFQILFCRDRRMAHKAARIILSCLEANPQFLDQTILQLWPGYRPGASGWKTSSAPNSLWVSTSTAAPNTQVVHFNLLEGQLLIDGETLGRLSQEYVGHPSYGRLFGQVRFCCSNAYPST